MLPFLFIAVPFLLLDTLIWFVTLPIRLRQDADFPTRTKHKGLTEGCVKREDKWTGRRQDP